MYGPLILAAFEKAGREIRKTQKYPRAKHLSGLLLERCGVIIGEKMLVNYYDETKKEIQANFELRNEIVQALCEYLGFGDYEEFQRSYSGNKSISLERVQYLWKDFGVYTKRNWYGLAIIVVVVVLIQASGLFHDEEREAIKRFMIWNGTHYIEVPLDQLNNYPSERLIDYSEELIKNFRKISKLDCNSIFFGAKGQPKIWYGKNADKELEYFSALAKHPETGKSLDDITPYMIRKYICPTY